MSAIAIDLPQPPVGFVAEYSGSGDSIRCLVRCESWPGVCCAMIGSRDLYDTEILKAASEACIEAIAKEAGLICSWPDCQRPLVACLRDGDERVPTCSGHLADFYDQPRDWKVPPK